MRAAASHHPWLNQTVLVAAEVEGCEDPRASSTRIWIHQAHIPSLVQKNRCLDGDPAYSRKSQRGHMRVDARSQLRRQVTLRDAVYLTERGHLAMEREV